MKNQNSGRGSNAKNEQRDSHGRFESNKNSHSSNSHSSNSSRGNSRGSSSSHSGRQMPERDENGRFTSEK